MQKFKVVSNGTLLDALKQGFPDAKSNTLRSWIRDGRVSVEGKKLTRANFPVSAGDSVSVGDHIKRREFYRRMEILFEDDDVVVIHKPVGMLSVSAERDTGQHAHGFLKERCRPSRVYPVHRLDRGTSGVMVFAKTELARDSLKEQLADRSMFRLYHAILEGRLEEAEGKWESFLKEDSNFRVWGGEERPGARWSCTHFRVEKLGERRTHVTLRLETGRKNQIRVHSSEAGYPVVGDSRYGESDSQVGRLCLHAFALEFVHPVSRKLMKFECAVPREFARALRS